MAVIKSAGDASRGPELSFRHPRQAAHKHL